MPPTFDLSEVSFDTSDPLQGWGVVTRNSRPMQICAALFLLS